MRFVATSALVVPLEQLRQETQLGWGGVISQHILIACPGFAAKLHIDEKCQFKKRNTPKNVELIK
jgi:hypothetical protein